jgi:hypothetical protein
MDSSSSLMEAGSVQFPTLIRGPNAVVWGIGNRAAASGWAVLWKTGIELLELVIGARLVGLS